MIKHLLMAWMTLYLVVHRKVCRHKWVVAKSGYIQFNGQTWAAELSQCSICNELSVTDTLRHRRTVGFSRCERLFIPSDFHEGDEAVDTFKIQIKLARLESWYTVMDNIPYRGMANHEAKYYRKAYPKMSFRVQPDRLNGWHKISDPV